MEKNYTETVASGGLTSSVSADSGLTKPGPTSSVTQTRTGKNNSTNGYNGGLTQSSPFSSHIEGPPPLLSRLHLMDVNGAHLKPSLTRLQTDINGLRIND